MKNGYSNFKILHEFQLSSFYNVQVNGIDKVLKLLENVPPNTPLIIAIVLNIVKQS